MKRLSLLFPLLTLPLLLTAQQKPQYSQYMINNYLLNPAITGIEDYADIKLGNRNQWTGIEGAPTTFYLSGHSKLGKGVNKAFTAAPGNRPFSFSGQGDQNHRYWKVKPHHGIGGVLLHDRIGPFARTEMSLSYAYHLLLSRTVKLSGGLSAGLINQTLRPDKMVFANPGDVTAAGWQMVSPSLSAGLWLYSNNFYVGASVAQLLGNTVSFGVWRASKDHLRHHYFLTGAYKVPLTKQLDLVPSLMVKWVRPLPVSVDVNLRMVFADVVWGGLSYRHTDSFAFLGGVTLSHLFDVGYSYDVGISSLGSASAGSHELVLGMRLLNRNKVICPQNMW